MGRRQVGNLPPQGRCSSPRLTGCISTWHPPRLMGMLAWLDSHRPAELRHLLMSVAPLRLQLHEHGTLLLEADLPLPLEVGRQRSGEPLPPCLLPASDPGTPARLILARQEEKNCSRRHLLLEPLPSGRVRVADLSRVPVVIEGGKPIAPGASGELAPPFSLVVSQRTLTVMRGDPGPSGTPRPSTQELAAQSQEPGIQRLEQQAIIPGTVTFPAYRPNTLPALNPSQLSELAGWLQTTIAVIQSTTGAADFLARAASVLVSIVGLDSGRVLLLADGNWNPAAVHAPGATSGPWQPS